MKKGKCFPGCNGHKDGGYCYAPSSEKKPSEEEFWGDFIREEDLDMWLEKTSPAPVDILASKQDLVAHEKAVYDATYDALCSSSQLQQQQTSYKLTLWDYFFCAVLAVGWCTFILVLVLYLIP